MKYLLDSNTFIEAKNRYYRMNVCPGYWLWIRRKYDSEDVASIKLVGTELSDGTDELSKWAKKYPDLFVPVDDVPTQKNYAQVVAYANSLTGMKAGALEDFLAKADPWLIAKAMTLKATVVTHESFDLNIKRKITIPNVCNHFSVKWVNTFEMLDTLKARFCLSKKAA